jgi:aldehyde dehydrogenase (NAD+)
VLKDRFYTNCVTDNYSNFMTPLQTQQSLDLTFDDSGAYDINSELLAFTNLDDSIVIDPSHAYSHYGMH